MTRLSLPLLVVLLVVASPSWAQSLALSGSVILESGHIDRGLNLSGGDPAATGRLFVDHESGFYGSVALSRVDDLRGNDGRIEGVLGRTFDVGGYRLDLSAAVDGFFGADGFVFPEFQARLSRDLGLVYVAAGVAYAPDGRWFVRKRDSVYGYLEAEVPIPRLPWLAATGHLGRESIAGARDRSDWGLGLVAGHDWFDVSLAYEDSDARSGLGSARLVAAISLYF